MSDPEIDIINWAIGDSKRGQVLLKKLTSLKALNHLEKDDLHYIVEALNRLRDSPELSLTEQVYLDNKWPLVKNWIDPLVGQGLLH